MDNLRHIKEFLNKRKFRYFLGILIIILVDLLQLVTPTLIGTLTDKLVSKELTNDLLLFLLFMIVAIALLIVIFRFLWRVLILGNARRLETWIREKLFSHLELMSQSFFLNNKTGDLMAHATNDIQSITQAFGMGVVMITDALFLTISTIAIMIIKVDLKLTLLALIPMPFLAIILTSSGAVIQKRFKGVQEAFSDLSETTRETISGVKVIKSFAREESFIDNFNKSSKSNLKANVKLIKVWGFIFPLVTFLSSLSIVFTLYYGGSLVIDGAISLGDFVAFVSYLGILTWPIMAIGWVINVLQRGMASLKRINTILDTKPDIYDDNVNEDITTLYGEIEFNNLSFIYPGTVLPVLKHISFKVSRGKRLGIIGRTGCGKTTLMNLIMRQYNVDDGKIFIDGKDINDIPLETLKESIGFVPQNNFLFSKSIGENIALSNPKSKLKKINYYSRIADIDDDINEFPDGYETLLGERGVNLSGGQKQRISIARALIKNPNIIILDDSLSSVDTETEEHILNNLESELKNKTVLFVSHRISTLRDCDEILVLDDGFIVQHGSHAELIEEEGFYKELYHKQTIEQRLHDIG